MDVKPTNLYLSRGRLLLGDFGQMCRQGDGGDGAEGDSTYMPVEAMQTRKSASIDVFSLGISFYELAADVELPENGPPVNHLQ